MKIPLGVRQLVRVRKLTSCTQSALPTRSGRRRLVSMMPSEIRDLSANVKRLAAQNKATGPTSTQGKLRSAFNATKHGLAGRTCCSPARTRPSTRPPDGRDLHSLGAEGRARPSLPRSLPTTSGSWAGWPASRRASPWAGRAVARAHGGRREGRRHHQRHPGDGERARGLVGGARAHDQDPRLRPALRLHVRGRGARGRHRQQHPHEPD